VEGENFEIVVMRASASYFGEVTCSCANLFDVFDAFDAWPDALAYTYKHTHAAVDVDVVGVVYWSPSVPSLQR
jgi:hypothetical protein